ncbi:MAG: response regulator, partial [Magnetococcales bacterium]|nr:response regulator [Magnetococcales bacterium]
HILVVDDSEGVRKVVMGYLGILQARSLCVASGEEAVAAVESADAEHPFDLILMDWKMPGMDGLQTARQIKQHRSLKQIPSIILMTAFGSDGMLSEAEIAEVLDGLLMKPVTLNGLSEAILLAREGIPAQRGRPAEKGRSLAGFRVLVAEDNEINQQVARELLTQVGVQVFVANNGQEAVTLAAQESMDAILMDLQMPVMDGLTATRLLRQSQESQQVPIIAMTANAMAGDREICLEAGMNDHIAKPVVPEEMYATLARWLPQRTTEAEQPLPQPSGEPERVPPLPPVPGIDPLKGLRNVGGNPILYRALLLKFARNQGGACGLMERCLAQGDGHALEQAAHALKGVAATVGAMFLAEWAGRIEQLSKNPEEWVAIPPLLAQASSALAAMVAAIETTLVKPEPLTEDAQPIGGASTAECAPLFRQAAQLFLAFDSSVEGVVAEMGRVLGQQGAHRHWLESIQAAVGCYDFERGLTVLHGWAAEEGIPLGDEPS